MESHSVSGKGIGWVILEAEIEQIEEIIIRMMLIGTPDVNILIESGEAELRELLEYVKTLPRTEYYVWHSPYTNIVMPKYVNVKSIRTRKYKYKKISAYDEVLTGE